jgi:hypothetical protein
MDVRFNKVKARTLMLKGLFRRHARDSRLGLGDLAETVSLDWPKV